MLLRNLRRKRKCYTTQSIKLKEKLENLNEEGKKQIQIKQEKVCSENRNLNDERVSLNKDLESIKESEAELKLNIGNM